MPRDDGAAMLSRTQPEGGGLRREPLAAAASGTALEGDDR